jgi:prolyl-tRNA synthetase
MYSYTVDEESHNAFYNKAIESYMNVYKKLGLGDITYVTSASGGVFTDKFSHEFQTICDAGEDNIYVHKTESLALNEEIFNEETLKGLGKDKSEFEMKKAAEVGNIFAFGTKKSEQLELYFTDKDGKKKPVYLGSYGIGVTRVMGVIAEVFADDKGLVWPESVAPFKVHLVSLGDSEAVKSATDALYAELQKNNIDTLVDDRDLRPGEKFADSDLIGIPWRAIISEKTIAENVIELKHRKTGEVKKVSQADFMKEVMAAK